MLLDEIIVEVKNNKTDEKIVSITFFNHLYVETYQWNAKCVAI